MIRNIQLRHAGKYTCAVQTKVDSASIAIDVVVRGTDAALVSFFIYLSFFFFTTSSVEVVVSLLTRLFIASLALCGNGCKLPNALN